MAEELKRHPLFIKDIPENLEDNPDLLALQSLLYDDTPEEPATHFNKKGNEFFKKGSNVKYFLKEALKSYTEGIESNSPDKKTNSKLYSNRAYVQLKLSK